MEKEYLRKVSSIRVQVTPGYMDQPNQDFEGVQCFPLSNGTKCL